MAKQLKTWALHSLCFMLLLLAYLINSAQLQIATLFAQKTPNTAVRFIGITLITAAILLALYTWLYQRQLNRHNPRQFGRQPLSKQGFAGVLLAFVGMLVIQIGWGLLIQQHLLTPPANQAAVEKAVLQLPLWNNLYDVLAAPVFEEYIFRGFFFNFFFTEDTPLNTWLGILVSGCLFGFMHTLTFSVTTLFYSALGCLIAWAYLHFKDLRYSMTLHFLNNLWSVL